MKVYGSTRFSSLTIAGLLLLSGCTSLPRLQMAPRLPEGLYGGAMVTDGGRVYLYGGSGRGHLSNALYRIDPDSGAVSLVGKIGVPKRFFGATVFKHRLFLFGGDALSGTRYGELKIGERILLGPQAHSEGDFPMPATRRIPGTAVVDGRMYLVGGWTGLRSGIRTQRVDIYQPDKNTWITGPGLPGPREGAVAVVDKRIYAIGGYDGRHALRTVYVLEHKADHWQRLQDLPVPASAYAVAVADSDIFLFGDYDKLGRVLRYDTTNSRVYRVDVPFTPRRHAAATRVGTRIVVAGGVIRGSGSWLDTVEVFDTDQLRKNSTPIDVGALLLDGMGQATEHGTPVPRNP